MSGAIANLGIVPMATSLFDRERIIAKPGFNRWLVPPAALAIHLCIGMAYGFSVFWLPLSRALGVMQPVTCPNISFAAELFTVTCDWRFSSLGWMYALFFVMLGSSAAIWGGWLERVGPRKAAVVSALCWCGGLLIGSAGIVLHQLWLLLLGPGIIGGIGLGENISAGRVGKVASSCRGTRCGRPNPVLDQGWRCTRRTARLSDFCPKAPIQWACTISRFQVSDDALYKVRTMSTRLLLAALGSLLVLLVAGVPRPRREPMRALPHERGSGREANAHGGAGLSRHCQSA